MTTLRPYQTEARYQVNAMLNASRHPLLVMPTGTGKTKTAAEIIRDRISLNRRVFVLTPQEEIFTQWIKELSEAGLKPGYINSDGFMGRNRSVYVCMPMSLDNMLHRLPESVAPDEIITDECHHSQAATWINIYNHYENALRLGLTATPLRMDNKPLGQWYTDIIETINMEQAIKNKYLAEPLVIVPEKYRIDVPIQNGDYDVNLQAQRLGSPQIIGNIIEQYGKIFCGLPILVACCTYEHAKMITEKFILAGWNFEHIHSKLQTSERRRMIREIKSGRINGLCTVGIGIEGMDIPGLFGLIWMRRTMSLTIYLQFIGRILRPAQGKKYGIIIDSVGNAFIHGRPDMERKWSIDQDYEVDWQEENNAPVMKICPVCMVMNATENLYCHICNFDFNDMEAIEDAKNKRKFPKMIDGNLVVLADEQHRDYIRDRLNEQKIINERKGKESEPIKIGDKVDILQRDLTGRNIKSVFKDTLRGFV